MVSRVCTSEGATQELSTLGADALLTLTPAQELKKACSSLDPVEVVRAELLKIAISRAFTS